MVSVCEICESLAAQRRRSARLAGRARDRWTEFGNSRKTASVGMSDGARIDYTRRQNLDISNEQVLPYYETSEGKVKELLIGFRD